MDGKKTYQTPQWKSKSKSYTLGKACEWCGHHDGDVVVVKRKGQDKEIVLHLVPHHRKRVPLGLRVYKSLTTKYFKEYFVGESHEDEWYELQADARGSLVAGAEDKDIKKRLRYIWEQKHRAELDGLYGDYKKKAEEDYITLTPDSTIILCSRCHYAREKGLVLCKTCKTNYHNPRYASCFICSKVGSNQ